jgi:hypothetical protein
MPSLFISYSRTDIDCARRLTESFKGQDLDFWIDWRDIPPTVDWWSEVKRGIEQAGVFLFLVSPTSIRSKVCIREILHSLRNGKRLIPVVVREVNPGEVPRMLSHLNWIFLRENDDFDSGFDKLTTAIKTDYEWVRDHRELQNKALAWKEGNRDPSSLLRGTGLELAESQLATNASKEPHPTDLQREYVLASRQEADKKRRLTTSIAIGVIIALAALAVFGWQQAGEARNAQATSEANAKIARANAEEAQRQEAIALAERSRAENNLAVAQTAQALAVANEKEAEEQARIAFSRQLAAQAQAMRDEQFDLALLLAVEASQGTTDGQLSLSNLLLAEPQLVRIVNSESYLGRGVGGFVTSLALSPDGTTLVAQSDAGARLWDLSSPHTEELPPDRYQGYRETWGSQTPMPETLDPLQALGIRTHISTHLLPGETKYSIVSNRVAVSACRTEPSAGGAPGCSSLVYIFDKDLNRLILPLASCSSNENARDFQVELKEGSFHVTGLKTAVGDPAVDFELYSVILANKASNVENKLVDAAYDPQTNRLAVAVSIGRMGSDPALIVWDLTDKRPIMELYPDRELFKYMWESQPAKINFSSGGAALDVCLEDTSQRIDIDPESWRDQACEIAGRNLTMTEWRYFFGDKPYHLTCPRWAAGE